MLRILLSLLQAIKACVYGVQAGLPHVQVEVTKAWGNANKRWNLFISRFFDCPMCSASDSDPDGVNACHNSFLEHYEFSYCRFHKCGLTVLVCIQATSL